MKHIMFLFLTVFLFCFPLDIGYSRGSSSRGFSSGSSSSRGFSSGSKSSSSATSKFSSGSKSSDSNAKPSKSFDSKTASASNYSRSAYKPPVPVSEPRIQQVKQQRFYQTYYSSPRYIHYYNDSFSPFFMLWLLDRSAEDRALWTYHHKNEMDFDRYKELLSKDQDLEKRLNELENKGVKRDINYKPQGIDNDLMYNVVEEKVEKSILPTIINWAGTISILFVMLAIIIVGVKVIRGFNKKEF